MIFIFDYDTNAVVCVLARRLQLAIHCLMSICATQQHIENGEWRAEYIDFDLFQNTMPLLFLGELV
jgi:hypothetical protein